MSDVRDVIMCAKFQIKIFMGYDFTGGRLFDFFIDFCILMRCLRFAAIHAGIVFIQWSKMVFSLRSAGATRCPDKCEIWRGKADHRSAPHAKCHFYRGRNVGIQPPNWQNLEFWP